MHHPLLCLLSVTSAFIKKTVFKPVKLNSLRKLWQVLAPQKDRDTSTYMATLFLELEKKHTVPLDNISTNLLKSNCSVLKTEFFDVFIALLA